MRVYIDANHPLGRTVFLDDVICMPDCIAAAEAIQSMDAISHENITVIINSYGGDVNGMLYLYQATRLIQSKIVTMVIGKAMSAGFFLSLMLASDNARLAFPNACFMAHTVGGFVNLTGQLSYKMQYTNAKVLQMMADRIGTSYEQLVADTDHDLYKYSEDALSAGWIDAVITPTTIDQAIAISKEHADQAIGNNDQGQSNDDSSSSGSDLDLNGEPDYTHFLGKKPDDEYSQFLS